MKPNITLVKVHPQLSSNGHPVDGALMGASSLWPRLPVVVVNSFSPGLPLTPPSPPAGIEEMFEIWQIGFPKFDGFLFFFCKGPWGLISTFWTNRNA